MKLIEWTKGIPTEFGHYWAYSPEEREIEIIVIQEDGLFQIGDEQGWGRIGIERTFWNEYWWQKIEKPTPPPEMVTIRFKKKNSWPYSIDEKIDGATIETIEVPLNEIYVKDNKRYYRCVTGHGESVELLVEE